MEKDYTNLWCSKAIEAEDVFNKTNFNFLQDTSFSIQHLFQRVFHWSKQLL